MGHQKNQNTQGKKRWFFVLSLMGFLGIVFGFSDGSASMSSDTASSEKKGEEEETENPEDPFHEPALKTDTALLRGLDKVTARVLDIKAPIGQKVTFGPLEIIVHSCQKSPPEDPPEAMAFLEIFEHRTPKEKIKIFSGWMFAPWSTQSTLEHPVYDIWVKTCVGRIFTKE